jgi:hypothetical protein
MFWQSVGLGLTSLLHWEIWLGMLGVGLSSVLFMMPVGLMMSASDSGKTDGAGCLFMMIGPPAIRTLAISSEKRITLGAGQRIVAPSPIVWY